MIIDKFAVFFLWFYVGRATSHSPLGNDARHINSRPSLGLGSLGRNNSSFLTT